MIIITDMTLKIVKIFPQPLIMEQTKLPLYVLYDKKLKVHY